MSRLNKSTIVRIKNVGQRLFFLQGEYLTPRRTAAALVDIWFAAPPRMTAFPLPEGGEPFEVLAQGHVVRGHVWGAGGRTIYLVHGWGGRAAQFGALVPPLVAAGFRVVAFDGPAHGESDPGPAGPRLTSGVELARALDAVAARFGPADTVIAHSMGAIATYLALRFGWLGAGRLVLVAPMTEVASLLDQFQVALGFGPRTRAAFDRAVADFVGLPVVEFDAGFQARQVDPLPTLVVADRVDRQTPYADAAAFAHEVGADLMTTDGLGHRKVLRDPAVIARVLEFVAPRGQVEATA